jgi:uncharacterized protein
MGNRFQLPGWNNVRMFMDYLVSFFMNPSENRLRSGWRILLFIVPGIFVMSTVIGLVPHGPWRFLAMSATLSLYVWLFARFVDGRSIRETGMRSAPYWKAEFWLGVWFASAAMSFIFLFAWLAGWTTVDGFGWQREPPGGFALSLVGYLIIMLCVAYYEELVFRGYLNLNLFEGLYSRRWSDSRWPAIMSVIIISGLFGLAHANNPNATALGVLNVTLAGIMLGIPFLATGRLGLSVGIHFAWNFVQGGILGVPVSGTEFENSVIQIHSSGPALYSGGAFGFEGGLIGTLGIVMILALTWIYLRREGYTQMVHPSILLR